MRSGLGAIATADLLARWRQPRKTPAKGGHRSAEARQTLGGRERSERRRSRRGNGAPRDHEHGELGPRASQRDSCCAPAKGAVEAASELTKRTAVQDRLSPIHDGRGAAATTPTDSQKHGATPSRRAIVGRSARVPLRQRAQVKRRATPEPWSEQAAPEPQGIKAQPINTTAGCSPLPLSPRGCSPEGVASAKGWARGSVYSDVGESQALANVSA